MGSRTSHEITALLRAWSGGDQAALDSLIPLVDQELRRVAARCLGGKRGDPILQTTALVNDLYVRLIDATRASWHDRAHFFAVCARIMRNILVDHARARRTAKRGGGKPALALDEAMLVAPEPSTDLVAIDQALAALAKIDARKARVVELRFFGGLSVEETADVVRVSQETIQRDWRLAKAWLLRELDGAKRDDASAMATG